MATETIYICDWCDDRAQDPRLFQRVNLDLASHHHTPCLICMACVTAVDTIVNDRKNISVRLTATTKVSQA